MYLEVKGLEKKFGNFKACDQVDFALEKGALAALLGPSGSGKTTILRTIAGLENVDSGEIVIDDKRVNELPASQRGIGFVFQNYALFRYMNVFDNIAFGLKTQKQPKNIIQERVEELLNLVGLTGLEKRYPSQLSGGQKQRVAFARALAPWPRILLLDEPFAAIDAKVRRELRSWLRETISKLKITSIFVTHDQSEAIEVADLIVVTNHGRVEQTGSPLELYRSPATPFVASFIGESTILSDYGCLKGFNKAPKGAVCAVRPEFIRLFSPNEAIQYENCVQDGLVERVSFRGNVLEVKVRVGDFSLVTDYSLERPPISLGDKVKVLIYRLYAFEGVTQARLVSNDGLKSQNNGYNFEI
ncbi:MAG: ATP-binding cassette domain-containing protein [Deltaproteobacteria bacterium]|jgi:sulfate transport system ATP-binding protein|nr:ATP-binding cassette domain-containing protein [Deltaproteobacteria bacterium]